MRGWLLGSSFILVSLLAAGCGGLPGGGVTLASVEVIGDSNSDGILNPGETASIRIKLRASSSDVEATRATLGSVSPWVTLEDEGDVYCGSISSGSTTQCTGFQVSLSPDVPPGTDLEFTVTVTSNEGSATLSFTLTVQATGALPAIFEAKILGDSNQDGMLSSGETASLQVKLINSGSSRINTARALLTSDDGLVLVEEDAPVYCGNMDPLGKVSCAAWALTVPTLTAAGQSALFTLQVTDDEGSSWDLPLALPIVATGALPVISEVSVIGDNNNDAVLNNGETAFLKVRLVNAGVSNADKAMMTLSAQTSDVTVLDNQQVYCGNLQPGAQVVCTEVEVQVPKDLSVPKVVPFKAFIVDETGASWDLTFELPVLRTAALPKVFAVEGSLKKGQVSSVRLQLRNAGTSRVEDVRFQLLAGSEPIEPIAMDPAWCGDIPPSGQINCTWVELTATEGAVGSVSLDVLLTDALGNQWNDVAVVPVEP